MKELRVKAEINNLDDVILFIGEILNNTLCTFKQRFAIEEAVEEIFVNISKYAYYPNIGEALIKVNLEKDYIEITFIDSGIEYNPLEKEDPDINLSVDDRPIGGLGIFMVKNLMDEVKYKYEDNHNILIIKKKLG